LAEAIDEFNSMFPRLTAAPLARLLPIGRRRPLSASEVIFERGSAKRAFYVLLEGRVEISSPSRVGEERVAIHEAGQFTGEVDVISGRHSLVRARALTASDLLEIDLAELRLSCRRIPSWASCPAPSSSAARTSSPTPWARSC
jgi:thioredoxin reductase (NADPH)